MNPETIGTANCRNPLATGQLVNHHADPGIKDLTVFGSSLLLFILPAFKSIYKLHCPSFPSISIYLHIQLKIFPALRSIRYFEYDVPASWSSNGDPALYSFIPNVSPIRLGENELETPCWVKTIVLVSTRDIEKDAEMFSDYHSITPMQV